MAQLLRTLDTGGALDVSGLPDPAMRARLVQLLGNLQTRHTRQVTLPGPSDATVQRVPPNPRSPQSLLH